MRVVERNVFALEPCFALDARFTDFNGMAGMLNLACGYSFQCQLRDCRVGPGLFEPESPDTSDSFINNLFERATLHVGTFDFICPLEFYNNTVRYSTVQIDNDWEEDGYRTIKDNLFDHSTNNVALPQYVVHDHNAYYPDQNATTLPESGRTLSTLNYAMGPLGNRYIGSSSPFSLVNAGSRSASDAGLAQFTIKADNSPDADTVDVGFHYFSVAAPTAYSGSVETCPGQPVEITLNGSDPYGYALSFIKVSGPQHGTLGPITQLTPNQARVTYTPNPGYCGSDSFTFKVNDGLLDSEAATISVTVGDSNPTAYCQDVMTEVGVPISFTLRGSDDCGSALTFSVTDQPAHGQITQFDLNTGAVTYTPNGGFEEDDIFWFRVTGCGFNSSRQPVSIHVVSKPILITACRSDRILLHWGVPEWIMDQYGNAFFHDFRIYRCESTSGSCTPTVLVSDGSARNFTDTAVEAGKTYCYRVSYRHRNTCNPPSTPEFYESPLSDAKCSQTCTQASALVTGNSAADGNGPIQTYSFTDGNLVNSFVPDGGMAVGANGRGLAIHGSEIFYTELGPDEEPTDAIHVAPYGVQGSGGSDSRTPLANPRPGTGIADLAYHNGALYVLTGYPNNTLQVFKLNPTTGAVLGGPISIEGPARSDSDGFTVLPNGNFLINDGDAGAGISTYHEYSGTTGGFVTGGLSVDLRNFGFFAGSGVATAQDGSSLCFIAWQGRPVNEKYDGFLVRTDLSGQLISFVSIGRVAFEDIDIVQ